MAVARPCGTYDESYAKDMAIVRTRLQWIILVIGLVFLFSLPLFLSGRWLNLLNFIGISLIAVHGLNILTGYCGQISLGQAAFMAVGAYTSGILTAKLGWSFWAALPCAALSAGIIGLIFGLPSLRVKGFYLAMATLAAQFIIPALISNPLEGITGGVHSMRVSAPRIGDFACTSAQSMFYIIIPIAVLMTFFAKNLVRTGVGRAFIAIRDNDLAAEVQGVNVFRYKLLAFFICSVYAGVAGCLWAHWMRAINPDHFTLMDSIWYVGMMIVGGMGSTAGAVFGVAFLRILDELTKVLGMWLSGIFVAWGAFLQAALGPIVYGLVIMLFIIFEPRGLAHRWEIFKTSYRLRPFAY
ncbi:MAG: branched-chain amino acid ABC transporter permease [Chloroflexi bacterium]|nr:branched-chain amino acid ABC transporter permease [Chloroflexota bacterium]